MNEVIEYFDNENGARDKAMKDIYYSSEAQT